VRPWVQSSPPQKKEKKKKKGTLNSTSSPITALHASSFKLTQPQQTTYSFQIYHLALFFTVQRAVPPVLETLSLLLCLAKALTLSMDVSFTRKLSVALGRCPPIALITITTCWNKYSFSFLFCGTGN
jgi:hypothetical protein